MEADEKTCPQCAETVKAAAKICRFCGHAFEAREPSAPVVESSSAKPHNSFGIGCAIIVAAILLLTFIVSLFNPDTPTPDETDAVIEAAATGAALASATEVPATSGLTGPQENARRNAEQYLAMTGFSRKGLIEQLSSDAGNGYSVADATAAVDSLTVDWNEQAVRSAQQYLEMTGFSCSGLIDQLSSDAGSGYTLSEARYGAERAGAC